MFKLSNLQMMASKPLFKESQHKLLRISVANIVIKTENLATVKNQTILQWKQCLTLPMQYNKEIMFEVFDKHQFGFNSDEFENILRGIIIFDRLETSKGIWDVYTFGREKVGTLSSTIVHIKKDAKETDVFDSQKQNSNNLSNKCEKKLGVQGSRSRESLLNSPWNQRKSKNQLTSDQLLNQEIKRIRGENEGSKNSRFSRASVLNSQAQNAVKKAKRVSMMNENSLSSNAKRFEQQNQQLGKKDRGSKIVNNGCAFGNKKENIEGDYGVPSIWDRN